MEAPPVRLHIKTFCKILLDFEYNFNKKLKTESFISDVDSENGNPLFCQDLNIDIINLLKHEDKSSLIGQIDQNSELTYLNRLNVTKFEILREQLKFAEKLKFFNRILIEKIDSRMNFFKRNGMINEEEYRDDEEYSDNCFNTLENENNFFYLNFNSKYEFEIFIRNLIKYNFGNNENQCMEEKEILQDKQILKFLKEFYILLRIIYSKKDAQLNNQSSLTTIESFLKELEERINLSFYNIRKKNYFEEDFELHKAVFDNNLRMIRKIIANETTSHFHCDINEVDPHGNTPLMLAIKLNNYDAINVLCDHDADIKHKSFDDDISPMEYAVLLQNRKILKILINAMKKQKITNWENNKHEVSKIIKSMPDFSMELKLNFDSNIFSLFSAITPSDFYKISKCGGNVRIDMNISAMNSSFKSIKGKTSILIKEKGNSINIYKIDHEKKIVNNIIFEINFIILSIILVI
jgi:hypothetical protein